MKRAFASKDSDALWLATVLRNLADDIEEGGVAVDNATAHVDAESDKVVMLDIKLKLNALVGSKTLGNLAHAFDAHDRDND